MFSPHAWGWSARWLASTKIAEVLPTRVGMVRGKATRFNRSLGSPHTRGDGPREHTWHFPARVFSPHAWGWSVRTVDAAFIAGVLPTRVGMVRVIPCSRNSSLSSPHTRGDGPGAASRIQLAGRFSPHAWGWSAVTMIIKLVIAVLPTRVGMVRTIPLQMQPDNRSPHTRGDGPDLPICRLASQAFSPHAWGWSGDGGKLFAQGSVLPTRVGMVRRLNLGAGVLGSSPHTRGDGPLGLATLALLTLFSPHAWGWSALAGSRSSAGSVLPTRVGMVRGEGGAGRHRGRSPHTRGDGPHRKTCRIRFLPFSPHAWGWSDFGCQVAMRHDVLPTRVGMVRDGRPATCACTCSPHTRGDGPRCHGPAGTRRSFSPHAWGWSACRCRAYRFH